MLAVKPRPTPHTERERPFPSPLLHLLKEAEPRWLPTPALGIMSYRKSAAPLDSLQGLASQGTSKGAPSFSSANVPTYSYQGVFMRPSSLHSIGSYAGTVNSRFGAPIRKDLGKSKPARKRRAGNPKSSSQRGKEPGGSAAAAAGGCSSPAAEAVDDSLEAYRARLVKAAPQSYSFSSLLEKLGWGNGSSSNSSGESSSGITSARAAAGEQVGGGGLCSGGEAKPRRPIGRIDELDREVERAWAIAQATETVRSEKKAASDDERKEEERELVGALQGLRLEDQREEAAHMKERNAREQRRRQRRQEQRRREAAEKHRGPRYNPLTREEEQLVRRTWDEADDQEELGHTGTFAIHGKDVRRLEVRLILGGTVQCVRLLGLRALPCFVLLLTITVVSCRTQSGSTMKSSTFTPGS